jgi:hypothetical protein
VIAGRLANVLRGALLEEGFTAERCPTSRTEV